MTTRILLACSFAALVSACAAEDVVPEPMPAVPEGATAAPADVVDLSAVDTLLAGGDFRFALDESEVLAKVQAACDAEPEPGETSEGCMKRIEAQAAGEGVRITPVGERRVRYLSYFHENGREQVHLLAEATLELLEPNVAVFTDIEILEGPEVPDGARLPVEVVDAQTIAMDKVPGRHPRTGGMRLVYHRR